MDLSDSVDLSKKPPCNVKRLDIFGQCLMLFVHGFRDGQAPQALKHRMSRI